MSNELTVELSGIKYLVIETLITEKNQDKVNAKIKGIGGIEQGIKEFNHGGFWAKPHAIVRYLIPENKIEEYKNIDL